MEKKREDTACNKAMFETTTYMCGLCGIEYRSKCLLEEHIEQHESETYISNPFDKRSSLGTFNLPGPCDKEELLVKVERAEDIDSSDTLSAKDSSATFSAEESSDTLSADESELEMGPLMILDSKTDYIHNVVPSTYISYESPDQTTSQNTCNRPAVPNACAKSSVLPHVSTSTLLNNQASVKHSSVNSNKINESSELEISESYSMDVDCKCVPEKCSQSCLGVLSPEERLSQNTTGITDHSELRQDLDKHNVAHFWLSIGDAYRKATKTRATDPSQYQCSLCDSVSNSASVMSQHMQSHSDIRLHKYSTCAKKYKHKRDLKYHMETHLDIRRHSCEICGIKCLRKSHLKVHMLTHRQRTVECKLCDKKFKSEDAMKLHSRIHTREASVTCPICNISITQPSYLKIHLQIHSGERPYKCEFCERSFRRKHEMKEHIKCHENARAFICHLCGKSFNTNACITRHIRGHNGRRKKAHKCEICNKAFIRPGSVNEHKMRAHNIGVRPYKCELCEKSFASHRDLRRHHLKHTGEKPYKCEYCPQRFSQQGTRNTHRLIHTGDKPRVCKICGMTFRHLSSLNNHMKKHIRKRKSSESKDQSEHNTP